MFTNFLFALRERGLKVSLTEWTRFLEVLDRGLVGTSLLRFYNMSRAVLVKRESDFDRFDQAFLDVFGSIESPEEKVIDRILEGLKKVPPREFTDAEKAAMEALDLDAILANFARQLAEGRYKGHVGGSKAIGTGGSSTQGAYGYNPAGIRIGQDESRHGRAVKIAGERRFKNYRDDLVLDVRQMKVALARLRELAREGILDEVDIDKTVDRTCREGGELEIVWRRRKVNRVRVLLLLDAGGSMAPHARLVNRLFSAARDRFRNLKVYYFHNCVYQDLWEDMDRNRKIGTVETLESLAGDWRAILVGDASMAPSELLSAGGAIDWSYHNPLPGARWLEHIRALFPRSIWLNPLPDFIWPTTPTIDAVGRIFPMFPLTLAGLEDGVRRLSRAR
ncbi:MAG: VWA domain-containing protein [Planctomycetes bacterium]|nr:VWA domain-containing protein [Planctomycetota bacterium]